MFFRSFISWFATLSFSEEQEEEEELEPMIEEGEIEPRSQKSLSSKDKGIRKAAKASELLEIWSSTLVPKVISDEIKVWQIMGVVNVDELKAISKKYALEFEDQSFSFKPPKLDNFVVRYAKDKDCLKSVCAAEAH